MTQKGHVDHEGGFNPTYSECTAPNEIKGSGERWRSVSSLANCERRR